MPFYTLPAGTTSWAAPYTVTAAGQVTCLGAGGPGGGSPVGGNGGGGGGGGGAFAKTTAMSFTTGAAIALSIPAAPTPGNDPANTTFGTTTVVATGGKHGGIGGAGSNTALLLALNQAGMFGGQQPLPGPGPGTGGLY